MLNDIKALLIQTLHRSILCVTPQKLISLFLKIDTNEIVIRNRKYKLDHNFYIVGFGKAAYGMACEVEKVIGTHIKKGIISVPLGITNNYSKDKKLKTNSVIKVLEGARNNLPDVSSFYAAKEIKDVVESLNQKDILLVLISGGGSALLPFPIPPVTLEEKTDVIKLLSSAGADIVELNSVRKKLSTLKGGKLAQLAYPAQVVSFILSDVVGDPIDYIASGPTVLNTDESDKAMKIVKKYNLYDSVPDSVRLVLNSNKEKSVLDFSHVFNIIIGNNVTVLQMFQTEMEKMGYSTTILSDRVEGLVQDIAKFYVHLIHCICKYFVNIDSKNEFIVNINQFDSPTKQSFHDSVVNNVINNLVVFNNKKQLAFIAGGEPTVKLTGTGIGGRNQELALQMAVEMNQLKEKYDWMSEKFEIVFFSAGTDGIDGPTDAAGAFSYSELVSHAVEQNINLNNYLQNNDSYTFYSKYNNGEDLIKIGHTGTNVMDIHAIIIKLK